MSNNNNNNSQNTINNNLYQFITGSAGTGKTTLVKKKIDDYSKENPATSRKYGILCATTGIAAINLGEGVTTINSLLKYFDTDSMEDRSASGGIHKILSEISKSYRNIILDEISMMDGRQFIILADNLERVNQLEAVQKRGGLGLIITGDFAQLPPIGWYKGIKFAFETKEWEELIATNIIKLEKVWRQDNLPFLEALRFARKGDGSSTAACLRDIKEIEWAEQLDSDFEGTTILALNKDVDIFNESRLRRLIVDEKKRPLNFNSYRWGMQRPEWKLIPPIRECCVDAYVMIYSNDTKGWTFANGSTGRVLEANVGQGRVDIQLNNGSIVSVGRVVRRVLEKEHPFGQDKPEFMKRTEWLDREQELGHTIDNLDSGGWDDYKDYLHRVTITSKKPNEIYFDFVEQKWCLGEINYVPIRLAYASTVHKTQGLTLDRVQIDPYNKFFGMPSMMYVALSRVREPGGVRIVGDRGLVEERTNQLEEVLRWI